MNNNNNNSLSCNSCDSCYSCNYCDSCYYCYYCYSCDYCNSCDYCDYCKYCDYCNDCNDCDYCDSCYYSKNLKMSEFQLFCVGYNNENFRVFNMQISEEEWKKIKIPKIKLEFDNSMDYYTRYQTAFKKAWKKLSEEEKQEFFNIPHFDWEIFTKITGVVR